MIHFDKLTPPGEGEVIEFVNGKAKTPVRPIIPVIEGDGIGRDLMKATRRVVDAAVEKAFKGKRRIIWFDVYAGEKAQEVYGELLPEDTLRAIEYYKVALKGPLTTPIGGGHRSLNVTLRQRLDLYACVRPVRYFRGVPSPVRRPQLMDVVIFRENTEDVYAGIEWQEGTEEAHRLIEFLKTQLGAKIRDDSGIGIKPMSVTGSKRLVRKAIRYALENKGRVVTMVHKGNIMKYTEGSFRDWGYQLAKEEFADQVVTEEEVNQTYGGKVPEGKLLLNDRIADSIFQQILTRTSEYHILATPNLNGDYLSDACAAQVGGLGIAPGANIGEEVGLFEATHGTAPKYADKDMSNPGSLILSACMMLDYMGWKPAAKLITRAFEKAIKQKRVTYDLERLMKGATKLGTSQFGSAIIENMEKKEAVAAAPVA